MAERLRLRQICVVAPELEPAVAELGAILGLEVCHRDPAVEAFGLANALFVAGTSFMEVVAPIRDGTAAGRFLSRSGARGGYIAIFDGPEPRAKSAHAAALGIRTTYEIDRPGIYHCVQLHPRDCRAAMLEFDWSNGGEELTGNWWPAGADWQRFSDRGAIRGMIGIEAVSPDPADLARHWSAILERPVAGESVPLIRLEGGEIRFGRSADGNERLETVLLDAADPRAVMARARSHGSATGPDRFALCGVTFQLA